MSADLSWSEALRGADPDAGRLLRVEAVFRVADEHQGQTVAAKLIDRVHEIANLPECECDVDVSVEWVGRPAESVEPADVPVGGVPPAREYPVER